jgi:diguanylate cyclase (GGDEF)-like protein
MVSDKSLALQILRAFDTAVLRRTGPRRYVYFGEPPDFYTRLFPSSDYGAPCASPWSESPMLEFFIEDAELFFEKGGAGSLKTGVWEEDGRTEPDTALSAVAITLEDAHLLLIRLHRQQYAEYCDILRRARVQLLENRELTHHVALFKEKSRIDGLTAIFNKATFTEILRDEMRRSRTLHYSLFLLLLDIDDFKKVNDTYGHPVGDAVLQALSATLKSTLRNNDIIARYGGEEFAVLIPQQKSLKHAVKIAEKIRQSIANMTAPGIPRVTACVGCTAYIAGESSDQLLHRADSALYDAKRSGKNAVRAR